MVKFSAKSFLLFSFCGAFLLWSGLSQAGIVITGSRVVYPAKEREVTIKLTNTGDQPSLVQAWVDRGNAKLMPDQADAPFLITPPIARVEPGKGQSLRLTFAGDTAVAQSKETLFWLNVLDVPPMPKEKDSNFLQLAVRSRLKIFYRPESLPGDPMQAAKELTWSLVNGGTGHVLRCNNTSAYHVSMNRLQVTAGGKTYSVKPENVVMMEPAATHDYPLPGLQGTLPGDAKVQFEWISDYGAAMQQESPLSAR